jgi:hypothetical protein
MVFSSVQIFVVGRSERGAAENGSREYRPTPRDKVSQSVRGKKQKHPYGKVPHGRNNEHYFFLLDDMCVHIESRRNSLEYTDFF